MNDRTDKALLEWAGKVTDALLTPGQHSAEEASKAMDALAAAMLAEPKKKPTQRLADIQTRE